MSIAEQYCRYGFDCLELVHRTDDPKLQERLVNLAESWKELAEKELEISADPVGQIKQWIAAREKALAKIDIALADLGTINLNRSHLSKPEKIDARFGERAAKHRLTLRQASQAWLNNKSLRLATPAGASLIRRCRDEHR
jgi:hypothetical protein